MQSPVVARLWIAAAEPALDNELIGARQEVVANVRSRLRVAAIAAEDLMNGVAGPRGRARSAAVAALVERFGDHAFDINFMGAAFIEEAVTSALIEIGVDCDEAGRVDRCRAAVLQAAAALDRLTTLIEA